MVIPERNLTSGLMFMVVVVVVVVVVVAVSNRNGVATSMCVCLLRSLCRQSPASSVRLHRARPDSRTSAEVASLTNPET